MMLFVVLGSAVLLTTAYWTYGPLLVRLLQLDPQRPTPAVTQRDDVDYVPLETNALLSQHFSAIAAAGPIVGPILAGVAFGWVPALCWIVLGSIFIGGVHDLTALTASIRHQARSMAEVVREHVSHRAFLLFLMFVWLALVYIVIAFTDLTAAAFVNDLPLTMATTGAAGSNATGTGAAVTAGSGTTTVNDPQMTIRGAGIASSSLMYLVLPIIMGLLLRYTRLSVGWATVIFLPLVGVAIWLGQSLPLDLVGAWQNARPDLSAAEAKQMAHRTWDLLLLGYCCVASIVPMWLLLQPRGHLGGYFLYVALAGGVLGLLLSDGEIRYPQFVGWTSANGQTLAPFLFIMIACASCSGFHALIASGTTSKQLRVETDARPIAYGAMLLEAMVGIVSLCCVMKLSVDSPLLKSVQPEAIYAMGIGSFIEHLGVPPHLGVAFALMAFTTFVYDTLDVCTRLGRYILQELTGWQGAGGRWFGTIATAVVPAFFVTQTMVGENGQPTPLWRVFWTLFGASNQLLAALSLLGVTVWLWQTRRAWWVWLVAGLPTALMYTMSTWALVSIIAGRWKIVRERPDAPFASQLVLGISVALVALSVLMLVEAVLALTRRPSSGSSAGTVAVEVTPLPAPAV